MKPWYVENAPIQHFNTMQNSHKLPSSIKQNRRSRSVYWMQKKEKELWSCITLGRIKRYSKEGLQR